MIQDTKPLLFERSWQQSLADLITDPVELLSELLLTAEQVGYSDAALADFALRVPREFVAKMAKDNPRDPLLLQVLPAIQEQNKVDGFSADPLGENAVNPVPGLLHKYQGRVLLTLAGRCAINCRYCFRRHFAYEQNTSGANLWQQAVDYVQADPSIKEIIYSGGEPLLNKDSVLAQLSHNFARIEHMTTLRIHTRLPVVIPQRVCAKMCEWLSELPLKKVLVVHCNHPNEIDNHFKEAMCKLRHAGVTVLNQSVLLRDVNDDAQVLRRLSEKLFDCGVMPYYLHVLDKVSGAAHFDIDDEQALALHAQLQVIAPGYLVPKLARECAGAKSKVLLK